MKNFCKDKFNKRFNVTTYKVKSFQQYMTNDYHRVKGIQGVDAYIFQLGVNDLRDCHGPETPQYKAAIKAAKTAIFSLLECSPCSKVVVSLPTPTPLNTKLDNAIAYFNNELNCWISNTRGSRSYMADKRLFTVNNASFGTYERDSKPLPFSTHDMLHVNSYGLKKLCLNIKLGLFRAFNITPHYYNNNRGTANASISTHSA